MKTLVLGDIHGRTCWKDIIEIEQPDKVIFLGDYVSTHEGISEEQQITNLREIMDYKIENQDKVILLRGNHDMQHCGFNWAECSGLYPKVQEYMTEIIDEFLELTHWIHIDDNIIFSHAGISQVWFNNCELNSVTEINDMLPTCKFGFTGKFSDYTGISTTQPPTWIRPQTLVYCAFPDYIYVVGHTPVKNICDIVEYAKTVGLPDPEDVADTQIWCCDNLPKEYLIIEDKQFKVKKYE